MVVLVYLQCCYSRSKKKTSTTTIDAKIWFLILKISNCFLHLKIHLMLSVILKTSNKMVFETVLQMVFVPKLFTVRAYGKN